MITFIANALITFIDVEIIGHDSELRDMFLGELESLVDFLKCYLDGGIIHDQINNQGA